MSYCTGDSASCELYWWPEKQLILAFRLNGLREAILTAHVNLYCSLEVYSKINFLYIMQFIVVLLVL